MYADIAMDWSDHALWWPERNHWLTRTRSTLDQYGVAADALLHFTPMHKTLRVQLPDMRCLDCKVDFSVKTFNAVINLCKELGEIFSLKIFPHFRRTWIEYNGIERTRFISNPQGFLRKRLTRIRIRTVSSHGETTVLISSDNEIKLLNSQSREGHGESSCESSRAWLF